MSPEKAKKARTSLMKECGLTESEATEVVNVLPKSVQELRVFTSGWKKLIPTDTVEKILGILKSNL